MWARGEERLTIATILVSGAVRASVLLVAATTVGAFVLRSVIQCTASRLMVAGDDGKRTGGTVNVFTVRLLMTVLRDAVNHSRFVDRFPCHDV